MEYDVILSGGGDVVDNPQGLADAVARARDRTKNPYTGGQIVMQLGNALARHAGTALQNPLSGVKMSMVFMDLGTAREAFTKLKAGEFPSKQAFKEYRRRGRR